MAAPLTKPCDRCMGTGTMPREVRKMADGSPDPLDFRRSELCDRCGGSGKVPDKGPAVERTPGYIADLF